MHGRNAPYTVYKKIIQKVMSDPECLPALPSVTIKVRSVIADNDSSTQDIANVCLLDPSFSALLMATVSSPIYARQNSAKSAVDAISILGRDKVQALAMAYSVKSLFVISQPRLKELYKIIWQRMMLKAATSAFIALKAKRFTPEGVMLSALLSEVGTLATLSAFAEFEDQPERQVFFRLCREYAKVFGAVLLKKWQVNDQFIDSLKYCGVWNKDFGTEISHTDLINLGLFCTVKKLSPKNKLPEIESLPSYKKLPERLKRISDDGSLMIVLDNSEAISSIQAALK